MLVCLELACDACRDVLSDGAGELHFQAVPGIDPAARAEGWTTDGRGHWHCDRCPPLLEEDLGGEMVTDGQLSLERGLGLDPTERRLRRAGYVPWLGSFPS